MEYTAMDILEDREKRSYFQKKIIDRFNMPIIVIKVNYPGTNKDNEVTRNIIKIVEDIVGDIFKFKIIFKLIYFTSEGPIAIMSVKMSPYEIKQTTIEIENKHILGRCVDIDVLDEKGNIISRRDLGIEGRKCFICNEYSFNCVRSQKHNEKEIISFILDKYKEYEEKFGENR